MWQCRAAETFRRADARRHEPCEARGIRRAAEGLDFGFLVTDAAGRTLKANRAFRRIVGEHPSGEPRALEEAFSGEPEAGQVLPPVRGKVQLIGNGAPSPTSERQPHL